MDVPGPSIVFTDLEIFWVIHWVDIATDAVADADAAAAATFYRKAKYAFFSSSSSSIPLHLLRQT